jgi:FixJ family two-component response regulator
MSGAPQGSRETILVVDDNELVLEGVVKILESANFDSSEKLVGGFWLGQFAK